MLPQSIRGGLVILALILVTSSVFGAQENDRGRSITVGSKNFNENYLLAEVISQLFEDAGYAVDRKFGMSGTMVIYQALRAGEVDVYVEYTGTLAQVILNYSGEHLLDDFNRLLAAEGIEALQSIGFNNSYAISLKRELADELGISTISELAQQSDIEMGFSIEFLNRSDGWSGLVKTYGFSQQPTGMDHGLAYRAIDEGSIDVTDAYTTDGDLDLYGLILLEDDLNFFPQYFALPLINSSLSPQARNLIAELSGRIDEQRMRELNGRVMLDGKSFAEVASEFLQEEGLVERNANSSNATMWSNLRRNTLVHLQLTLIALSLGCAVGLPVGIAVYRYGNLSRSIIYIAGLMQTIPSIALLALFIPLFGIGRTPAIIALFLYSLLPILRSTITALLTIDPALKRIAEALGMTRMQQLTQVLIPLALPNVLSGIKTAAIICIGTATLAAFIGAGGLGEPIVTGLALNDTSLILQGAIPAACLAILTELLFEMLERVLIKPHMLVGQLPT
ncbi:MAG: ABC transporter permease subunit [Proteobacteria bacterium]|nr:ABC transporter permease subunit [Pseudomonadota bacterium]